MERKKDNLILFGTGRRLETLRRDCGDYIFGNNIKCFFDNNPKKWNTEIDGIKVVCPDHVREYNYDYILITTKDATRVADQLVALGVDKKKILTADEYYERKFKDLILRRNADRVESSDRFTKSVLFILERLTYNGAVMAICYAAEEMQKRGFHVEVATKYANNSMLEEMEGRGLIIDLIPSLKSHSAEVLSFIRQFNMVLCNSIELTQVALWLCKTMPTCLWIHEPSECYTPEIIEKIDAYGLEDINIFTVNSIAEANLKKMFPDVETEMLAYGIKEFMSPEIKKNNSKIFFSLVGGFSERKAQNLFLDAIEIAFTNSLDCEFWLIGENDNSSYGMAIRDRITHMDNVIYKGLMTRHELAQVYNEIDVIVCPSLEDPLPIVVTEGMMKKKTCIVSDSTGSAEYITQYQNGIICKTGDARSLADAMIWCVSNKEKLGDIGNNARETYNRYFSMEAFGDRLERIYNGVARKG